MRKNRISSKNFLLYYNDNKLSIQETYKKITKVLPTNTLFEIVITKNDSRETYVFISCEKKIMRITKSFMLADGFNYIPDILFSGKRVLSICYLLSKSNKKEYLRFFNGKIDNNPSHANIEYFLDMEFKKNIN